jgi:tetratricopeptide (TPR) repeat protein
MNSMFVDILKKLTAEQGKEALLNPSKCKAFLADYTKGEYKKESRLLLQALDAGVQKEIDTTAELELCKRQQVRVLHEEYGMDQEIAVDVVDTLVLVLKEKQESETPQNTVCLKCGKELQKDWKACPYCGTSMAKTKASAAKTKRSKAKSKSVKLPSPAPVVQTTGLSATSVNTNQQNAKILLDSGMTYFNNHEYDKAITQFSNIIQFSPHDASAYNWRGDAYLKKGQNNMAIKDYDEAIRLDPNNFRYYIYRGRAQRQIGLRDRAIQDLEKALGLNPELKMIKRELQEIRGY